MGLPIGRRSAHTFRIVCFGGSAGALHAYVAILNRLPRDTGMAFVVIAHTSREFPDLLRLALSPATTMPVINVEHGMRLSPNRVFVMPPGVEMTLAGDSLELRSVPDRHGWPTCISVFLRSLAQSAGTRAVAVILSGDDADGSSAIGAIRDAGGVTFAQADAPHSGMPDAAVATGCVDFVLPSSEIAGGLLALAA